MAKPKLPTAVKRSCLVGVKLTPGEANDFKSQSIAAGYPAGADYLRALINADKLSLDIRKKGGAVDEIAERVAAKLMGAVSEKLALDLLRLVREAMVIEGALE